MTALTWMSDSMTDEETEMTADLRERERPSPPAELGGVVLLLVLVAVLMLVAFLTV